MVLVSVIITTHSRPGSLVRAIDSARQSASAEVEVVVVDDASVDETASVCAGIPGIRYVRVARNQGVAGARNIGILASRGEFLTFLDDDDERLPRSLDRQLEVLAARPGVAFVYGQSVGDDLGRPYPERCPEGDVFWELVARNFVPCGTVVVRRSALLRVGLLDSSIPGIDDWDLWVRLAERHAVATVAGPVLRYRASSPGSGQGSSVMARLATMSDARMRQCWLQLPRAREAPSRRRRDAARRFSSNVAAGLVVQSWLATAAGVPAVGAKNLATAMRRPLATARFVGQKARQPGIVGHAASCWRAERGRNGGDRRM